MIRWMGLVGIGLLAALVAVILLRPAVAPTDAERATSIGAELRCPDCAGLSVADSHTAAAVEIRRQISELIADGATDAEVRAEFVDSYGPWILLQPATPAYWIIPLAAAVLGALGLGAWLLHRRAGAAPSPAAATIGEEQRRRIHDEVEALDA